MAACATGGAPSASQPTDAVVGLWKCERNGTSVRIERRGELYVMLGVADRSGTFSDPDVIGEFRPDPAEPGFIGRHIWGGRWGTKTASAITWGKNGGLRVLQLANDQIFIQYADSKYTGGWTYQRVR
jgi:hypothetical protein